MKKLEIKRNDRNKEGNNTEIQKERKKRQNEWKEK